MIKALLSEEMKNDNAKIVDEFVQDLFPETDTDMQGF